MRTVLNQCSPGSKSVIFFNNPSETLPALFEFLFVLYAVDSHFTRELTGTALVNLVRCHSNVCSVPAYSCTAALSALSATLPALFCKRALGMPLVRHTKEQLLRAVLAHFPSPQAIDFVVKFLFLARAHHASWQAFSRLAYVPAQELVKTHHLHTFEDLWRLCSLWTVISPKSFVLDSWLKILDECKENARRQKQEEQEEEIEEQVPLSPETELGPVLEALGLSWIPGFLAVARHALAVPTELLLTSKEGKSINNESTLCKIAGAATAAMKNYAATKWCAQLPGLAESVALVTSATESLIRRIMNVMEKPTMQMESLTSALSAFESVLKMKDIVAVVRPFGSLVRLMSSLCIKKCDGGRDGNTTALLFYHGILSKRFAQEENEVTSRNAKESSLTIWLLGELAYYMKISTLVDGESFVPEQTVLAKLFQNRTFIKTKFVDLKCIFENEANTDIILAAALRCITPSVTNRGARNFLAVMAQLPRTQKLTQVNFIIIIWISCLYYSFCVKGLSYAKCLLSGAGS